MGYPILLCFCLVTAYHAPILPCKLVYLEQWQLVLQIYEPVVGHELSEHDNGKERTVTSLGQRTNYKRSFIHLLLNDPGKKNLTTSLKIYHKKFYTYLSMSFC